MSTAIDLGEAFAPLPPIPAADPGGARPPRAPTQRMEEVLLPSGRAVRIRAVKTREYLGAKERAAATAGDPTRNPDPGGRRYAAAVDRELLALALVAYTGPLDWGPVLDAQLDQQERAHRAMLEREARPPEQWPPFVFVPDAAALLATIPPEQWVPTTPLDLLQGGEGVGLESVFDGVADWEVLVATTARLLMPSRDLSGIAGKGRAVVR